MIGVFDVLVIDCPNPGELAEFYAAVLGVEVYSRDDNWAEIAAQVGPRPLLAFQRVDGEYTPPQWPGQDVPQQMHIDVKVDDFDVAEPAVLALGATKTGSDHETFRVYLDPAGHPFCLITPND
jgi:catechol 2,3-dioxygenase-like lactoylglutathione lyase family enzyme